MLRQLSWKSVLATLAIAGVAAVLLVSSYGLPGIGERGEADALQLVYRAGPKGETPTDEQMQRLVAVITRRVERLDVVAPLVERLGEDRVLVELPGIADAQEAKDLIARTAHFEIVERICEDVSCSVFEDRPSGLTDGDITRAFPSQDLVTQRPTLSFELNRDAAQQFAVMTQRIFSTNATDSPDQLALVLDGEVLVSAAMISPILAGAGIIQGSFTPEEVRQLAIQIESGRLPVGIEEISSSVVTVPVDAELPDAALVAAWSGLLLTLAVLAWLTVRKRKRRRKRVSRPSM